ncbi:MAG: hypothetical protein EOL87_10540 [Spartobacteria bacterium]|nr:hypothetical protein [Spartobacteria bacterium]
MSRTSEERLYTVAERQQGYFTTKQAYYSGIIRTRHRNYVEEGKWTRIKHGIYRLTEFPKSHESKYVVWTLWSRKRDEVPQGVISHESALVLHKLIPEEKNTKIHMTVPADFFRSKPTPDRLIIHKVDLPPEVILHGRGYRLTTVLRSFEDALRFNAEPTERMCTAAKNAMEQGLLTEEEMQSSPEYGSFLALIL